MHKFNPLSRQGKLRRTLIGAALATLGLVGMSAQAATFPDRAVRIVVPFGPGTTTDTIARIVAEAMSKPLGQQIVVENRAGGGGTIGTTQVARAPADGYTLVMGTVGTHAINQALYKNPGYDPVKDFEPVAFVGQTPTFLVTGSGSGIQTLKDLGAAASKGEGVAFASAGSGTSGHLAGELLKSRLGGEMVHVPYKEGGLAVSDVMSGQVQFMFYHPAAVLPHIQSGKLRALGVSSANRSSAAPDVPSIAEQTGSDFDLVAWFMLYAPQATPEPVMATLRKAASEALSDPQVLKRLSGQGVEQGGESTRDLTAFEQSEIAKWSDLVKKSGAQVN
ncbi:Bug family tripartite tricarboxylate transporter substrate binding protein [Bordetella sp. 02P26C-1]|uniref:Bug family tripartite tricarboxylate transporter substrate binding protein n=1 Tax=Bordetella sp. 02P26C-1 TaxID=2683195 RepID=UPI001353E781|nr:tripartite tricarboxylate transporter substrate binding protein [Bordetella sp. 02P26C-1]MVW79046.1 tripartite tricarboxylate transporter substrate binding protein [Bordetella sp. 02P26C-1]